MELARWWCHALNQILIKYSYQYRLAPGGGAVTGEEWVAMGAELFIALCVSCRTIRPPSFNGLWCKLENQLVSYTCQMDLETKQNSKTHLQGRNTLKYDFYDTP